MARARLSRFLAAFPLVVFASLAQAAPCSLASLSWMAGVWHNAADPQGAQERWVVAPHDVLMGSAWEFPKDKAGYAEIMTIARDGDSISMLLRHFDGGLKRAWEERAAPMVFTASSCVAYSVIFDGQSDHAGEHLTYRRSGDKLLIMGDFIHHGIAQHEEWQMIRAGD